MATLMEALRGQLAAPLATPAGGGETTNQLADLLRAKSGRAITSGAAPRMSTLSEQSAAGVGAGEASQVQASGEIAAAQLTQQAATQTTQARLQNEQVQEADLQRRQQFADRAASILQEYKQGQRQLDLERDASRAEQLGFLTRLTNEQYITQLEQTAARQRLHDEITFNEALAEEVFGAERELLEDRLGMANILNMDENAFRERMGQIDIDAALAIASIQQQEANQQARWSSAGQLVSAASSGYSQYSQGAFDSDYQTYRDAGGTKGYEGWKSTQVGPPKE